MGGAMGSGQLLRSWEISAIDDEMTCRAAHLGRLRRNLCRTSTFQIAMDAFENAGPEPGVI
jgi:hypothetical protein